ncbi:MAG: superoxide dismutase [Rhodococcus sp. (in: high G+C Gram-positive bacteria)]
MKHTRLSAAVALAGATALVLTGCSSSDSSSSDGSSSDNTSTTSASSTSSSSDTTSAEAQSATVYMLPGTGVFPEGITVSDDTFYVTSTSDGTLFRGTVGNTEVSSFLPGGQDGRTGAAGVDVDGDRIVIAGGATGTVWIYSDTGELEGKFTNGLGEDATFLNDVVIADNGDAFITDSRSPNLWRIPADASGEGDLESFVDFTGSPFEYGEGFNANGIVEAEDDNALVIVQSSTGNLYRVARDSKEVTAVDLGGETLANGDGMELEGDTLYVVRNRDGLIATVDLADDGTSGEVTGEITDPSFAYPTTVADTGDELLVVNSQFDERGGNPSEPFTVSGVSK